MHHRLGFILASVILCAAEASGQPAVVGGRELAPLWDACRTRRVDVICIGDSNQLHRGAGWDEALSVIWAGEFGSYATGLHTPGENAGSGAGVGAGSATINTGGAGNARYADAPPTARDRMDSETSGLAPSNYLYIASGESLGVTTPAGLSLSDEVTFGFNRAMRFHLTYATFTEQGGAFTISLREDGESITELQRSSRVSTSGGDGVARIALDLPAQPRTNPLSLRLAPDIASPVNGPFVGYYMRAEAIGVNKGVSVHSMYAKGGMSAYDMALALQSASNATLALFMQESVRLQNGAPTAVVRVCTGLNDRAESLNSIGPDPQTPGNSPTAYADNLTAIIERLQQAWTLSGFDVSNLYFIITPSHTVPGEDERPLRLYRAAAKDVAKNKARVAAVDLGALTDAEEIEKKSWFASQGDYNHLRQDGMRALARRELDALLEAAKP